ncbi:MAG: hypothetical protein ACJAZ2_000131 [Glaciecola sp.]|jgi:uncharacterized protein (DUF983 family)
MEKGSWKYSVWKSKCPRCQKGNLWQTKKAYTKGFSTMEERCSECDLKYTMEQGFWYGAMYISYAFGVLITVSVVITLSLFTELKILEKSGLAVLVLFVLMPLVFRYSRNIWLNIFVHFEKKFIEDKEIKK